MSCVCRCKARPAYPFRQARSVRFPLTDSPEPPQPRWATGDGSRAQRLDRGAELEFRGSTWHEPPAPRKNVPVSFPPPGRERGKSRRTPAPVPPAPPPPPHSACRHPPLRMRPSPSLRPGGTRAPRRLPPHPWAFCARAEAHAGPIGRQLMRTREPVSRCGGRGPPRRRSRCSPARLRRSRRATPLPASWPAAAQARWRPFRERSVSQQPSSAREILSGYGPPAAPVLPAPLRLAGAWASPCYRLLLRPAPFSAQPTPPLTADRPAARSRAATSPPRSFFFFPFPSAAESEPGAGLGGGPARGSLRSRGHAALGRDPRARLQRLWSGRHGSSAEAGSSPRPSAPRPNPTEIGGRWRCPGSSGIGPVEVRVGQLIVLPLLKCRPRLLQLPGVSSRWDKSSSWGSTRAERAALRHRRGTEGTARKIFIPAGAAARVREKPAASPLLISWRGEVSCLSLLSYCNSGENRLACKLQNSFRMASSHSWLLG